MPKTHIHSDLILQAADMIQSVDTFPTLVEFDEETQSINLYNMENGDLTLSKRWEDL